MKKILSIILAILMIVTMLPMSVLPASAADTPVPYDGVAVEPMKISEENYKILGLTDNNWSQFKNYYAIRNAKELYGFAALINALTSVTHYNAVLLQDIVVNENGGNKYDWTPINMAGHFIDYNGIFDGNGHYISGLYSTVTVKHAGDSNRFGGFIANLLGTVKNLTIKDSTFAPADSLTDYSGVGAITGYPFDCAIKNCRVENVKFILPGYGQAGGIAGYGNGNKSTIKNCVSIGVTISGATYSDPIAPKAPYSKCYTSADAEHKCADISVQHKTVLATCAYPGRSNYKYCLVCGEVTTGTKTETAAKGHNWNAATCTDPKTCKTCGEIEGTVLPHTWTEIEADNGYEHSRKCTVCGLIDSKGNHSWVNKKCEICNYECAHEVDDNWILNQTTHHIKCIYGCGAWLNYNYHKFTDGVCTECEYECVHTFDAETYKCTNCKMACPHNMVEASRVNATCSAQGLVRYECTDCGYDDYEVLDTTGHLFTYTYTDAYHIGECEYCDYILHQSHKMAYTYTDPTCEDYGYQIHACEVCSYGNTTTYAEPLYHTGGEATCTSPAICDRCSEPYGETAPHYGGEATCTESAICEICGQSYGEPAGHDPDMDDGDCTTDIPCEICGVTVEEGNKNHTWDENNFCSNPNCYETKGFTFTFTYGEEELFTRNVHTGSFYTFETLEERDGLTFLGWDADEDGVVDYAAYDYIYISEDRAFNAVYGLMYTVHYITYDIWDECYGEYFYPSTGEPGQIVTLHSDYSPYYNFLGWAMEEGGEVVYEPNEEIALTENLTLYGVIRPYRATFELGEGAVWNDENGNPITCLEGDYSGSWVEIYNFPTRTGYIFKGFVDQNEWTWEPWQDEETGEWIVDFYFDARDLVMTALWEECTDHSFTDSVCDICGYECIHENTENDVCTDCGKDVHICDFDRIEWTTDETAHWKICSCGAEEFYGEHAVSDGLCEICGMTLHVCDFSGEWFYDSEKHWKECSCGVSDTASAHTYIDGACECGYECSHKWVGVAFARPTRTEEGYYTYTCSICKDTKIELVERASNYAEFKELLENVKGYLDENLTDSMMQEVNNVINFFNLDENHRFIKGEENTVSQMIRQISGFVEVVEEGIADGTAVKVDGLEEIVNINDKLNNELAEKYGEEALAEIAEKLDEKFADKFDELYERAEALTGSVAENKDALAEIEAEMEAIFAEAENCLNGTHNGLKFEVTAEAKCGENAVESATCTLCGETVTREVENSALKHSFTKYEVTEEAKCGVEGKEVAYCDHGCGETDEKAIEALKHDIVIDEAIAPKCGETGLTQGEHCTKCDYKVEQEIVAALGHKDADGDCKCDNGCGHEFEKPAPEEPTPDTPDEPTEDACDHLCHKGGFMGLIWKIVKFFSKLFKMNPVCECGVAHY